MLEKESAMATNPKDAERMKAIAEIIK
jgi:hypothetical protein